MQSLARLLPAAALVVFLTTASADAQWNPYYSATATVYNGSGTNPPGFTTPAGPYIGSPWKSSVALGPGSSGSMLFLGLGGVAQPGWIPGGAFGRGELLCLPPLVQLDVSGSGNHSVFVPHNYGLVGMTFCAQAAVLRLSPGSGKTALVSLELQNALILQIGAYSGPPCTEFTCGG